MARTSKSIPLTDHQWAELQDLADNYGFKDPTEAARFAITQGMQVSWMIRRLSGYESHQ